MRNRPPQATREAARSLSADGAPSCYKNLIGNVKFAPAQILAVTVVLPGEFALVTLRVGAARFGARIEAPPRASSDAPLLTLLCPYPLPPAHAARLRAGLARFWTTRLQFYPRGQRRVLHGGLL